MKKIYIFWIIAIVITISAAIYQKMTGPTYPKKVKTVLNNTTYKLKLIRSWGGDKDCEIKLDINDPNVSGKIYYKRYKTNDEWTAVDMQREGDYLIGKLPWQPPAGKLMYYLELKTANETNEILKNNPNIIRFKGDVPNYILVTHIFFMFFAMLLSTLSGAMAVVNYKSYKMWGYIAFTFLIIGGLIFGPIVQKYAFGEYWAGIPFGWDLTDNKTLIAFIAWLLAIIINYKTKKSWPFVLAAIVVLVIFSIPHSMHGSELDYSTKVIKQG